MAKNSNLHAAKAAKNDEFYTQLTDIEKELAHYKEHFGGVSYSVTAMTQPTVISGDIFI